MGEHPVGIGRKKGAGACDLGRKKGAEHDARPDKEKRSRARGLGGRPTHSLGRKKGVGAYGWRRPTARRGEPMAANHMVATVRENDAVFIAVSKNVASSENREPSGPTNF
jgi:hypothetical protein